MITLAIAIKHGVEAGPPAPALLEFRVIRRAKTMLTSAFLVFTWQTTYSYVLSRSILFIIRQLSKCINIM